MRLEKEHQMAKVRQYLDTKMPNHVHFELDFVGEKMEFKNDAVDRCCLICHDQLAQVDKWYYPCRRHCVHLNCYRDMKIQNDNKFIINFVRIKVPIEDDPRGYVEGVQTHPYFRKNYCSICKGSGQFPDRTEDDMLQAVVPGKQHLFSALKYTDPKPLFLDCYGVLDYTLEPEDWSPLTPHMRRMIDQGKLYPDVTEFIDSDEPFPQLDDSHVVPVDILAAAVAAAITN